MAKKAIVTCECGEIVEVVGEGQDAFAYCEECHQCLDGCDYKSYNSIENLFDSVED